MSVIHAPKQPEFDSRLLIFPIGMGVALAAIFARLWYFQVIKAPELAERAEASEQISVESVAPRGIIRDRRGRLVAGVRPELTITAVPDTVLKHPEVLDRVAALVGTDRKRLDDKLQEGLHNRHVATPIFIGASAEAGSRIAEMEAELPGIAVQTQPTRFYPDPMSFGHVIGYVWTPDAKQADWFKAQELDMPKYVGKSGIEKAYELDLMGSKGREYIEVDAKKTPLRVVGRDNATPGKELTLTLDAELQALATKMLTERGAKGSIVAIEPSTGEVLCLVSAPTYDPTKFVGGISNAEWSSLLNDPGKPMMNRALQTPLAPGSTFKIVTAIAAAKAGIWNPSNGVSCGGGFRLGSHTFKCMGTHGSISFERAMEKSCNTYFCTLGYRVGRERFVEVAKEVGLAQPTGIEIGGEHRGSLPDDRWLSRNRKPAVWYGGDVVNASIGQGAVGATPIQMANIMAMVANDGVAYVPHLVRSARSFEGLASEQKERKIAHQIDLPAEFWTSLRRSLGRVIASGTARSAQIPNVEWGGKTGSAEHRKGALTHSWFVGMAPLDAPKIAVCVRVEAAGHGGDIAAPIAKAIVERYLAAERKASASARAVVAAPGSPNRS